MFREPSEITTRKSTRKPSMRAASRPESISRRAFIKRGAVLGATSILAGGIVGWMPKGAFAQTGVDIAAVKGVDYYRNTLKAVETLGGMQKFVSRQSRVGLLINGNQDNPGSYVKPDIVLAVVRLCLDAGAREVGIFKRLGNSYWRRGKRFETFHDEVRDLRFIGGDSTKVAIPQGRALKEAELAKALLECDVFINMPIAKDHTAVRFTGNMKNMMGATTYSTNRFFHFGSGSSGWYDDVKFLSQCIADVNLVRAPDLSVFDGTEVIVTNGPSGPGKLIKPQTVFAGTDRVAMDVFGANLIGLKGEEILATRMAHEHGLGRLDLANVKIQEVAL